MFCSVLAERPDPAAPTEFTGRPGQIVAWCDRGLAVVLLIGRGAARISNERPDETPSSVAD